MTYLLLVSIAFLWIFRAHLGLENSLTYNLALFVGAGILLLQAANLVVTSISHIARYLGWREFVIAFFVMAIGGAIPNLFVGIFSALHDIPELSFGDIVGNGLADLTIVAALAVFWGNGLNAGSRMIQASAIFAAVVAVLPLLLILDGTLDRGDGLALILIFLLYSVWLFRRRRMGGNLYSGSAESPLPTFRMFVSSLGLIVIGIVIIGVSAQAVIDSSSFFAVKFGIPIELIGILVVGLGSALPETYFSLISAKKGNNWVILGVLMGSVVVLSTLILGIVATINPIEIRNFSPFALARVFLIISAILFLLFLRTGKKISKKEALILLALYLGFVAAEISSR